MAVLPLITDSSVQYDDIFCLLCNIHSVLCVFIAFLRTVAVRLSVSAW